MPLLPFGRAFWWAQGLGGLVTLPPPQPTPLSAPSSSPPTPASVHTVLHKLRARLWGASGLQEGVGALVMDRHGGSAALRQALAGMDLGPRAGQQQVQQQLEWLPARLECLKALLGARSDVLQRVGGQALLHTAFVLPAALEAGAALLAGTGGPAAAGAPAVLTHFEDVKALHSGHAASGWFAAPASSSTVRHLRALFCCPPRAPATQPITVQLLLRLTPAFPEPGSFSLSLAVVPHYSPPAVAAAVTAAAAAAVPGRGAAAAAAAPPPPLAPFPKALTPPCTPQQAAALRNLASLLRVCSGGLLLPPALPPLQPQHSLLPCLLWAAQQLLPLAVHGGLPGVAAPLQAEGWELPRELFAEAL